MDRQFQSYGFLETRLSDLSWKLDNDQVKG